ncbi:cyclic lactone autoinducer peptide [Staphylococcus equorum]|nr:cyclic lactone autoinducer peptide [Staphylococcus equorum]PTE94517.1 cyclic lactone autoinducer peptide [Staphylococcus equorum]
MHIFESIFSIIAKFFSTLGAVAGARPCYGYFDETEVPKEITELYE